MSEISPKAFTVDHHPKSLDLSYLRLQNSKCCANKLPAELLLRIFVVGDEEQRARRKELSPYRGFQDLVTQVCTHWRNVAIENSSLWTYIYISQPPPHNSAALYLIRCGQSTLLDIDLRMTGRFFDKQPDSDNWDLKISRANETIKFLAQHGAFISRWKSLIVSSRVSPALYSTLEHIYPESAPALQFLSVEWRPRRDHASALHDESRSIDYLPAFEHICPGSDQPFSQLRHAEFIAAPSSFLFRRPLPILVGLTRLKILCGFNLFPQEKLYALLSANPQLESLDISMNSLNSNDDFEPADYRVSLPHLRSLIITWNWSLSWALEVIQIVDDCTIERLALSGNIYRPEEASLLAEQIINHATGKDGTGTSPTSIHDPSLPCRRAYFALQHLDVSGLCFFGDDCTGAFIDLFSALPEITHLTAPADIVTALANQPSLLPRLEWIKLSGEPPEGFGRILYHRAQGGCPVKVLEIHEQTLELIQDTLPESLLVITVPSDIPIIYYDSDNGGEIEAGDWSEDSDSDYDDYPNIANLHSYGSG
ncbi:hypothetical protein FRC12_014904 [Ceratobasidium sp. 428]|nr:hypothetical protein FRC12_014904 [Ceratobasidium sp. 428]